MDSIGLARGTVKLSNYDSSWPKLYEAEANLIRGIVDVAPDNIQHIGSTSIPGMIAKPIIDIAILVDTPGVAEEWQVRLESMGY